MFIPFFRGPLSFPMLSLPRLELADAQGNKALKAANVADDFFFPPKEHIGPQVRTTKHSKLTLHFELDKLCQQLK